MVDLERLKELRGSLLDCVNDMHDGTYVEQTVLSTLLFQTEKAIHELIAEIEQLRAEKNAAINDIERVMKDSRDISACAFCEHSECDGICGHGQGCNPKYWGIRGATK